MSASLVGSEMCIRDSLIKRHMQFLNLRWEDGRAACAPLLDGFSWDKPVSYTHLTLPTICSV
eukprot:8929767-Alexandrium_andersonii.AAC.1